MGIYCQHELKEICDVSREVITGSQSPDPMSTTAGRGDVPIRQTIAGKLLVCAYCGHVRHVYADGIIEIVKAYGEFTNPTINTRNS